MAKYKIRVRLSGVNGNAYAILGTVHQALKQAKVPDAEIEAFMKEAKSGDYDHLLQTCMRYVDVE